MEQRLTTEEPDDLHVVAARQREQVASATTSGSANDFEMTGERWLHPRHERLQCSATLISQRRLRIRPATTR